MNYIFIDSKNDIEKVGIIEDDRLVEFYTDAKDDRKQVGNIYRGKAVNVLQGMEAAFVDIGEGKNAYLYVKDALPKESMYKNIPVKIDDIVKNGEDIIVQVLKESSENKGPKITTHITLPGRFLVLTPFSHKISVSRKIHEEYEVNRLQDIGKEMQKEDMGVIFRTKALGIEKEVLIDEYHTLIAIYKRIEKEKNFLPCPKLIYKEMDLAHQIVRDAFSDKIDKIVINDKEKYNSLLGFQDIISPNLKEKLFYDKDFDVAFQDNIGREIQTALERKVNLESGGYIVIDETEALTAIDVNTGKFIGDKSLEDTIVKTNLEAVQEISRQIRLRDIGGIIIIDFIDMRTKDDISLVLDELEKDLSLDRNKTNIIGITKLGLVEMTRKKVRNSLRTKFIMKCPYCNGKGKIFKE
jgi:ribonuclease G